MISVRAQIGKTEGKMFLFPKDAPIRALGRSRSSSPQTSRQAVTLVATFFQYLFHTKRFSDSEVIMVALAIQTFFAGRKEIGLWFLRQYHSDLFPHLVEASRFNRRRQLSGVIEMVRRQVTRLLIDPQDRVRVLDSAPIPACIYTRSSDC